MRPTDNLSGGDAPPFPYVLAGEPANSIKPGAVEFAPSFHNGEVQQAEVSVEETLPWRVHSLGQRSCKPGPAITDYGGREYRSRNESEDDHLHGSRWQRLRPDQ